MGWSPLDFGVTDNTYSRVNTLIEYSGKLIAGGDFVSIDGMAIPGLAQWDGTMWNSLGSGLAGPYRIDVRDLAVYGQSLYVAGNFQTAGGLQTPSLARWDGSQWHTVPTGLQYASSGFHPLLAYDGYLMIGGYHTDFSTSLTLARWDGVNFQRIPMEPSATVFGMATFNDLLVVTGSFSSVGSLGTGPIAFYGPTSDHADPTCDSAWNLADHATLRDCLTGPAFNYPPGCLMSDLNSSSTIDLADFASFQNQFAGM